jgi:hypothetical protein
VEIKCPEQGATLLRGVFQRPVKGGGSTRLQLLSAAAEPPLLTSLNLPIEQLIKIVP